MYGPSRAEIVEAGPLVVDHRARQVRVDGAVVRLCGREFELAARLATDPRRVFTKTGAAPGRVGNPHERDPHQDAGLARLPAPAQARGRRCP